MFYRKQTVDHTLPEQFASELLQQYSFKLRSSINHLAIIGGLIFTLLSFLKFVLGTHYSNEIELAVAFSPVLVYLVTSNVQINSISRFTTINSFTKLIFTCGILASMTTIPSYLVFSYSITFYQVTHIYDQMQVFPNQYQQLQTLCQYFFVFYITYDRSTFSMVDMLRVTLGGLACEYYSILDYQGLNTYLFNKLIQIQKLEAKWSTLLKHLKVGVATFSGLDFSLSFCNDSFLSIFGLRSGSLKEVTAQFSTLVTVKKVNQQRIQQSLCDFLKENLSKVAKLEIEENASFTFKIKASHKVVEVSFQLCQGEEQLILMMVNDVTTVKNFEKSKQIQKMKTIYFCSVAHDLKTPINSILANSQYLASRFQQLEEIKKLSAVTKASCQLLLRIIQDITDLSKIELKQFDLDFQWCDIEDLLSEVQNLMQLPFDMKKIKLNILPLESKYRHKCRVNTDSKRLKQILLNLIGNALKFTFKGEVQVSVDIQDVNNLQQQEELKQENEQIAIKEKFLEFKVKDTGIGIKEENINQLFKLFGKVKEQNEINKQGIGLGLTICKRLTELLGGTIKVKSEFGKGTEFTFTVNCQVEECNESEIRNSTSLMLIDDDIGSFRLLREDYIQTLIFPSVQWEESS